MFWFAHYLLFLLLYISPWLRSRILNEGWGYKKETERAEETSQRRGTIWSIWMDDLLTRDFISYFIISIFICMGALFTMIIIMGIKVILKVIIMVLNIAILIIGVIHIMYIRIRMDLNDFYQTLLSRNLILLLIY